MTTQYRSYGSDRSSSSGTLIVILLSLVLGAVALAVFIRHATTHEMKINELNMLTTDTGRIGVVIGSSFSVGFGLEALIALGRLLGKLVQAARRLPPATQVLILGSIVAAVAHPKSRAKLLQLWGCLNRSLKPAMWEAIVEGMYQFVEATSMAKESYQAVQEILPPSRQRPLLLHARAVCLAARSTSRQHGCFPVDAVAPRILPPRY